MTKSVAKNGSAGSSPATGRLNTVVCMANDSENRDNSNNDQRTDHAAPGGNPDNSDTVQNMDAPELRTAVIELLTIIDDSDDMDVVVTIADDGTVVVEAA
ncbi:MAG: hypothetical protein AB1925_09595 [Actinomycetota bacterium]